MKPVWWQTGHRDCKYSSARASGRVRHMLTGSLAAGDYKKETAPSKPRILRMLRMVSVRP